MTEPTRCPTCHQVVAPLPALTKAQHAVLACIAASYETERVAPTYQQIAAAMHWGSTSTAWGHVTNLVKKGYVHRAGRHSRALILTAHGRRAV